MVGEPSRVAGEESEGGALADVLRTHADCSGNLDVVPGPEAGTVTFSCDGCGASGEYATDPATGPQPHVTHREVAAAAAHSVAVPSGSFGARYGQDHSSRVGRRRRVLRNLAIAMAIVVAIFGTVVVLSPPEAVQVTDPGAGAAPTAPTEAVTVDETFTVALPDGWGQVTDDGVTTLSAAGGGPSVYVDYVGGSATLEEIAAVTEELLRLRHPDANVRQTVDSDGSLLLRSTYDGGTERARVSDEGEISLVVATEIPTGSEPEEIETAEAVAASVSPVA